MRVFLSALLALFVSQSTAPASINFFSTGQDIEIGTESSANAEKQLPIIRDAHLNQYVRTIAQRLLTKPAGSRQLQYQFRIVNSSEISSLGFPNGYVYIYRGLLNVASTDDEVAAILAHEIGHVSSRHATSQLSRQLLVLAPISLSTGLPNSDGWKEQLTKLGVVFGANAAFLHYSPDQEREASDIAAKMLASAKFDPNALNTVVNKINEAAGKGTPLPAFLYNHPLADVADSESERSPRRGSVEFRSFHTSLEKLAKPSVTKELSIPNDLVPQVFEHEFIRLSYPDDWQVTRTSANGAIIAPANGVRSSDVTRGVMFDMFPLSETDKPLTLEQATARVIVYLRQSNVGPGSAILPADQTLRAVPGAQTPMLIHGEPALRSVLLGKSQATGSSELVWLVTRIYYKTVFYMVFVAPEEEFASHQPVFEQMIQSVQLR